MNEQLLEELAELYNDVVDTMKRSPTFRLSADGLRPRLARIAALRQRLESPRGV